MCMAVHEIQAGDRVVNTLHTMWMAVHEIQAGDRVVSTIHCRMCMAIRAAQAGKRSQYHKCV